MTDLAQSGPGPTSQWHRLVRWLWPALFALAIAPTVAWLWHRWTLGVWQSGHAILMPLLVAYLTYEALRDDPEPAQAASSPWGFVFLVPALLLLALDSAIGSQILSAVAIVVALPGLSLVLLGAQRTKRLIFPIIISAFALPVPAAAVEPINILLRQISTWGSMLIVPWMGIPVFSEGTYIYMPNTTLAVTDACSGFSTLYAAMTTALILSHWSQRWGKRIQLLVGALVLTLVCNSFRVAALVWIVRHYGTDPLDTPLHEATGMVMFVFVLALGLHIIALITLSSKKDCFLIVRMRTICQ